MGAKKLQVTVDVELKEIVPNFLENRRKELPILMNFLKDHDFMQLKLMGHRIKGTGGGYGFQWISWVGEEIEKNAEKEDGQAIQKLLSDLDEYLSKVEVVYGSDLD